MYIWQQAEQVLDEHYSSLIKTLILDQNNDSKQKLRVLGIMLVDIRNQIQNYQAARQAGDQNLQNLFEELVDSKLAQALEYCIDNVA